MAIENAPNVGAVRAQARADWEKTARRALSVQEKIGDTVPWWLVIIAGVALMLSAPHTIEVFSRATPVVGYAAPLIVEFSLLYAAFRRKQTGRTTWQLAILEVASFLTAIIVNGIGSLYNVIGYTEAAETMSYSEVVAAFPALPIMDQATLLIVPIMAIIIPVGTAVAGEGLASLMLERNEIGSLLNDKWEAVRYQVELEALQSAAIEAGFTPKRAGNWAKDVMSVSAAYHVSGETTDTNVRQNDTNLIQGETGRYNPDTRSDTAGGGHDTSGMTPRDKARAYLMAHPEDIELPYRVIAERAGVSHSSVARVIQEARAELATARTNGNGNGHGLFYADED